MSHTISITEKRSHVISIVVINVLNALPDLFVKINIASLANHAFYILAEIGIEQVTDIIADILFILINLVLLHLFEGHKLAADKGIVLCGFDFIFCVCENINQMREPIEQLRAQLHSLVDERIDDAILRMETDEQSYELVRLHALNWKPSEFKGTKVMAVILPDGREIETKTWRSAVEVILKDCAADPVTHEGLLYLCGRVNGNFRPLLSSRKSEMDVPIEIEDGLYFEGKLDTEQLLRVLVEKVLEPAGYDCSAVLLKHRETVQLQERVLPMLDEPESGMVQKM